MLKQTWVWHSHWRRVPVETSCLNSLRRSWMIRRRLTTNQSDSMVNIWINISFTKMQSGWIKMTMKTTASMILTHPSQISRHRIPSWCCTSPIASTGPTNSTMFILNITNKLPLIAQGNRKRSQKMNCWVMTCSRKIQYQVKSSWKYWEITDSAFRIWTWTILSAKVFKSSLRKRQGWKTRNMK